MLRYDRQTKPGLVALYDIRPGNGAGQFLQPRSPHGALGSVWSAATPQNNNNIHQIHQGYQHQSQRQHYKAHAYTI